MVNIFLNPEARVINSNLSLKGKGEITVFVRANTKRGAIWRSRIEASDIILLREQENIKISKVKSIVKRGGKILSEEVTEDVSFNLKTENMGIVKIQPVDLQKIYVGNTKNLSDRKVEGYYITKIRG